MPINRFGLGKNQQSSSTAGMLLSLSPFLLGEIPTFADESPSSLADSLDFLIHIQLLFSVNPTTVT